MSKSKFESCIGFRFSTDVLHTQVAAHDLQRHAGKPDAEVLQGKEKVALQRPFTQGAQHLVTQHHTQKEGEADTGKAVRGSSGEEGQQAGLQQAYDQAHQNAVKMKEMHDKLIKDIGELNARRDSIKAKMAVAKTQERLNKIGSSVEGAAGNLSAFDRMEEKANRMLDEANAMAELNASSASDDIDDLAAKYDDPSSSPAVDDELAALKAKLGK